MESIATFLNIIAGLFTLVAGSVTALWVYTKYVLERGFLPPIRFYVAGKKIGMIDNQNILDIKIHLHNIGSATLIARNIRVDLRYISKDQALKLFKDDRKAGRLDFPNSLIEKEQIEPSNLIPRKIRKDKERLARWIQQKHRGFLVLEHDTFVQAGVDQVYTFVTKVPEDTLCFLTWCSFQYAQEPSPWQKRVSEISRKLGLIQYTLEHVEDPHSVEDVFWIADNVQPGNSADK